MALVSWDVVSLCFWQNSLGAMREFYTNRTSRGPCRTEALTVDLEGKAGCAWDVSRVCRASAVAEGAIFLFLSEKRGF